MADVLSHEFSEHNEIELEYSQFPVFYKENDLQVAFIDSQDKIYALQPETMSAEDKALISDLYHDYQVHTESYAVLTHSGSETTMLYAVAPVFGSEEQPIGFVCLLLPLNAFDTYVDNLRLLLGGSMLGVILLGIAVSVGLTNYFSRQFSNAQDLAATVASGDYHLRIPEKGPIELRNLSHYLNLMAEKLEDQTQTRQTLLANVAHELARPLAGLQLGIESLRKGAVENPELTDDLLVGMAQTVQRFESLIDDITLAAQPKSTPIVLEQTAIPVEPFLRGIANRFWSQADSQGIAMEIDVEKGIPPVYADEKRLNQIIGNLLSNAIKFSPDGGIVHLMAESTDDHQIRISVRDHGEGIHNAEAEYLFEPFYQGDIGRRIKQGMGLGLAIALQLARAHGGGITIQNHPDGGTVAIVTLPRAEI
jgi:signal transduction histidine kinase